MQIGAHVDVAVLVATDPGDPYGATLKAPESPPAGGRFVGATVIIVDGALAAYLARGERQLLTWLPESERKGTGMARTIARVLLERARSGGESPRGMLIEEIDGGPAAAHPVARFLTEAGFTQARSGSRRLMPEGDAMLPTRTTLVPAASTRMSHKEAE